MNSHNIQNLKHDLAFTTEEGTKREGIVVSRSLANLAWWCPEIVRSKSDTWPLQLCLVIQQEMELKIGQFFWTKGKGALNSCQSRRDSRFNGITQKPHPGLSTGKSLYLHMLAQLKFLWALSRQRNRNSRESSALTPHTQRHCTAINVLFVMLRILMSCVNLLFPPVVA